MKALVTGATGFAGGHLARLLAASQAGPIDGTTLESPVPSANPALRLHACDVTQGDQVERVLSTVRPTHLFHLAAPAHVGESFERPLEAIQAITAGAVTVLAAAQKLDPPPRVLLVSSAEVYGAGDGSPITEAAALESNSPYGVGKLTGEAFARYLAGRGLPVVIARPFNHIGPGQSDRFVCSAFARQIAEAEAGLRPPVVEVGNLSPERDFTDVRDTVRAYPLILEHGKPGEAFNVASGRAIPISKLLEGLVALSKIQIRRSHRQEPVAGGRVAEAPGRCGQAPRAGLGADGAAGADAAGRARRLACGCARRGTKVTGSGRRQRTVSRRLLFSELREPPFEPSEGRLLLVHAPANGKHRERGQNPQHRHHDAGRTQQHPEQKADEPDRLQHVRQIQGQPSARGKTIAQLGARARAEPLFG